MSLFISDSLVFSSTNTCSSSFWLFSLCSEEASIYSALSVLFPVTASKDALVLCIIILAPPFAFFAKSARTPIIPDVGASSIFPSGSEDISSQLSVLLLLSQPEIFVFLVGAV